MALIPKLIWTFWNSKELPVTVENCIKSWKFLNPNYKIIILNPKNVKKYLSDTSFMKSKCAKESFARLSDFIRIHIIYKYGGFWIDASTICCIPFDNWIKNITKKKKTEIDFIGYYSKQFTSLKRYPVIENWFFCATKKNSFIKLWRDEFKMLLVFDSVDDYLENRKKELGVNFQYIDKYDDSNYLAMHIAAQKILQYDKYSQKNMIILNAQEGPLKYRLHRKAKLTVRQRVKRLCDDWVKWGMIDSPIIKFTGEDREVMEKYPKIRNCVFDNYKLSLITEMSGIK